LGLVSSLVNARPARAAGFELTHAGARGDGRAGAEVVGGDSPVALFSNPANIGRIRSRLGVELGLHLHFTDRCFQQVEVIETGDQRQAGVTAPDVCADAPVATIPELAASVRLGERLALGFGVFVPPAGVRHMSMGDPKTVTIDPDGEGGADPIPAPSRYMLAEEDLLQLFLTAGVAYQPHPRVRIGVSFGWGVTKIDFTNVAYSRVQVLQGLGDLVTATADARNRLRGVDAFVPRVQLGVWGRPFRHLPLEMGASFQYTADVRTKSATLDLRSLETHLMPEALEGLVGDLEATGRVKGVGLRVPQTNRLALGVRYADALPRPVDGVGDRLSSERFDVELDVVTTLARRVKRFDVDLPDDASLVVPSPVPLLLRDIEVQLPDAIALEHRFRTQVSVRVGGDYNPIPGVLGIRAGVAYESHGVARGYEQLDFTPFRQASVHLGGTWRVAHRVDLSVAYAHVFQPTVVVSPQQAAYRRTVGGDADPSDPADATLVNAGRYRGRSDVLVLQAGAYF
jgi:hypothetical protein